MYVGQEKCACIGNSSWPNLNPFKMFIITLRRRSGAENQKGGGGFEYLMGWDEIEPGQPTLSIFCAFIYSISATDTAHCDSAVL